MIELKKRPNFKDLTGKVFGSLTCIKPRSLGTSGMIWECQCSCGNIKYASIKCLQQGKTKRCRKCKRGQYYGDMSGYVWCLIKSNAVRRKKRFLEFNLTKEYVWNLFIKQDRKCALSGIVLNFPEKRGKYGNASLDRIDSSKGYIEGNVQWVDKKVNIMKQDMNDDEFIKYCKTITQFQNEKHI